MASLDPDIRAVISGAIEAPSGENAQPWRFRVIGKTIEFHHHPKSDQSLYNYKGFGTLVCEGSALENMLVVARSLGYQPLLTLFPDASDENFIASITLGERGVPDAHEQTLARVIPLRTTNRKKYSKKPVPEDAVRAFEQAARVFATDGISFQRVTDKKTMDRLAVVASTNERLMLGNEELHHFFFSHLTWTQAEDREKKVGFYIKTLELPPPARLMFRVFQNWKTMRVLKALGFPIIAVKTNGTTYASSAEMGIIAVEQLDRKSFVAAGRAFERIWLEAVSRDLSAQPLTGTLFMNIFAENVAEGHFSKEERELLKKENDAVKAVCAHGMGIPIITYRVGFAPKPSARASRFALEDLLII